MTGVLGELILRELLMLVILTGFGVVFAVIFGRSMSATGRVALAPVFGLCFASAFFTMLVWGFRATETKWLIPIGAVASIALGVAFLRRERSLGTALHWSGIGLAAAQMLVVAIAVLGPTSVMMAHRDSVGPVAYQVADAGGYVLETDGMIHESSRTATSLAAGGWNDLTQAYWTGYAVGDGESAVDPVSADVDALIGLGATQTQAPFLLAVLLIGALGIYGVLVELLGRRSWFAVLGGVLCGGSMFLQLFFDGSEGAICGLVVLAPLAYFAVECLRKASPISLVALGVLFSGSLTLYPLFAPPEVLAAAVVLGLLVLGQMRQRLSARSYARGLFDVALAGVVALGLNIYSSARDVHYILDVSSYVHGQPNYLLPVRSLLSWLTQLRGLYDLSFSNHSIFANLVIGIAVPLVILLIALLSSMRHRVALVLLGYGVIVLLAAFYDRTHVKNGGLQCTYCEERTLLPLSIVIILTTCLGLGVLAARSSIWSKIAAPVFSIVLVSLVTLGVVQSLQRFSKSYFLPQSVSAALSHLPKSSTVALEGFNEGAPNPMAELMLTYAAADENDWEHVSVTVDTDENNSLLYFGNLGEAKLGLPDPYFHVPFDYVLTRVARVQSGRTTIYRNGPVALQKLPQGAGVLLDAGFSVEQPVYSNDGGLPVQNAWVNEPMRFVATGPRSSGSYVRLWFTLPSWLGTPTVQGSHLVHVWRTPHKLSVCLRALGPDNAAIGQLQFPWGTGERLREMKVSAQGCPTS